MGRTNLLKNSSGRSPLTDGKMPCLLRYDWSKSINAERSHRNRTILRSSHLMVFLVAPGPVFHAWLVYPMYENLSLPIEAYNSDEECSSACWPETEMTLPPEEEDR
ncbi:hypothetical protein TNCV_153701 [Trichonephila clavipes]|nr:hypothetical protein TNCV_153701 [Trichonephila clavipes]